MRPRASHQRQLAGDAVGDEYRRIAVEPNVWLASGQAQLILNRTINRALQNAAVFRTRVGLDPGFERPASGQPVEPIRQGQGNLTGNADI